MKRVTFCVLAAGLLSAAGTVNAATVTRVYNTGTTYSTTGLTAFSTDGNDMVGMTVTASWANSNGVVTTQTATWAQRGNNNQDRGGVTFAVDNDFQLVVQGDTYSNNNWDLDFDISGGTYRLLSLTLDGTPGRTVFDACGASNQHCTSSPYGTDGSDLGRNFDGFGNFNGAVTGTYFDAVAINSNAPVGDLFARFRISFGNGTYANGLGENEYSFTLDTDNASTAIIIQPADVPVSEPATLAALGLGLLGMVASRRRTVKVD